MTLHDWAENRWLHEHQTSRSEIADLLSVIDRDLEDASIDRLSADWRLGISYNAALQLANLALAASGYRTSRERSHERAIQSLRFTVGFDQPLIDVLDTVRRKRNTGNYDRAGTTSDTEAAEIYELTANVRETVVDWMRREHPGLLP